MRTIPIILIAVVLAGCSPKPDYALWPPGLRRTLHPDPAILEGSHNPCRFSINSMGLRGPEPKVGDYRILCVGGSTTECMYLDDEASWPQQLDLFLGDGYWVGNAGHSAHTSHEHLQFLRRTLSLYRIDAVILLCGINDWEALLKDDADYFRWRGMPDEGRDERTFARCPGLSPMRAMRRAWTAITYMRSYQGNTGAMFARWRQYRADAEKVYEMPPMQYSLFEYGCTLFEIAQLCQSRGVKLLFVTQPTTWASAESPRHYMGGIGPYTEGQCGFYLSATWLYVGMQAYNGEMVRVADRLGVPVCDPGIALELSGDWAYDDCHFNPQGARVFAGFLADCWRHHYGDAP